MVTALLGLPPQLAQGNAAGGHLGILCPLLVLEFMTSRLPKDHHNFTHEEQKPRDNGQFSQELKQHLSSEKA